MRTLFVAYDFPPVGGAPVQRVVKLIKYVQKFGVTPLVLTNAHGRGRLQDTQLLSNNNLGHLQIIRRGAETLNLFHEAQHHNQLRHLQPREIIKLLYDTYCWGDVYGRWFRDVHKELPRIIHENKIDCVWTTAPPASTHLLGIHIQKTCSIPWIMDLRDAMLQTADENKTSLLSEFQNWRLSKLERKYVSYADAIVSVSQPIVGNILKRCRNAETSKFHVIPNGYDEDDFARWSVPKDTETSNPSRLRISYTGTFMGKRRPDNFILGLNLAIQRGDIRPQDLRIDLAGRFPETANVALQRIHSEVQVVHHGFLPHTEAIALAKRCDLFLVITTSERHPSESEVLTGKIFEALGLRKQVLALTHSKPLIELIEDSRLGTVTNPADPNAIADSLTKIYRKWKDQGHLNSGVDEEIRETYNRKNQARSLAKLIHKLSR